MSEIKLPEPNLSGYRRDIAEWDVGYTADQMKAAILEERERCAKVCDEWAYHAAGAKKAAEIIRSK